MSEEPIFMGYMSLPPELQAALEADYCSECGNPKGPDCERHGRVRIEIVADMLGREARVDYDADMAYFEVRPYDDVFRTDVKLEDRSLIIDYTETGEIRGIEVFLVRAAVRQETADALQRLIGRCELCGETVDRSPGSSMCPPCTVICADYEARMARGEKPRGCGYLRGLAE